jgi:hypothetical protein
VSEALDEYLHEIGLTSTNSSCKQATFNFVVGPDQQQFYLHPALGLGSFGTSRCHDEHMEESLNHTTYLKETDAQTFALFAEFAYAGNYLSITTSSRISPVQPSGR